jgi:hypothetical protein
MHYQSKTHPQKHPEGLRTKRRKIEKKYCHPEHRHFDQKNQTARLSDRTDGTAGIIYLKNKLTLKDRFLKLFGMAGHAFTVQRHHRF